MRSTLSLLKLIKLSVEQSVSISTNGAIEKNTPSTLISSDRTIDPNETHPAVDIHNGNDENVCSATGNTCDENSVEHLHNEHHEIGSTTEDLDVTLSTPVANVASKQLEMREPETIDKEQISSSDQPSVINTAKPVTNEGCSTSEIETTLNITSQESSLKETSTEVNSTVTSVCSIAGT